MNYLYAILLAIIIMLVQVNAVQAQETNTCHPLFGGGPSCVQSGSITLDKKVLNPQTNSFIDHADINGPIYAPGQTVVFQVVITNTGSRALEKVLVTDIMPQYMRYTKGDGTYNRETNILSHTIARLEPKQIQTLTIEGTIVAPSALPQSAMPICVVNQATATQGRNTGSDNTQLCIGNEAQASQVARQSQTPDTTKPSTPQVQPVPTVVTTPSTGPELLALAGLLPAGITGWYLRRKTTA